MFYVAYGSNLHPARLSLRLPESRFRGTATISGRMLRFHKRSIDSSGKCNIATGAGSIHVAVYKLNRREKAELDEIERLGSGYDEETIELPGFGECFTYVATASHIDDGLRPFSWYKELVLAGCEYLEFPTHYTSVIRGIATIDDPDRERHAMNMQIVDIARNSTSAASTKDGK